MLYNPLTLGMIMTALAFLIAVMEINVEGRHGWAGNLPTWKLRQGPMARLYSFLMTGKPLTGYHASAFPAWLLFFHLPFAFGTPWSGKAELIAIALFFTWGPTEDFLWFMLNPTFGPQKFKKEYIRWYQTSPWIFGLFPLDYLSAWGFATALTVLAQWLGAWQALERLLALFGVLVIFTFLICATVAKPYRMWHDRMVSEHGNTTSNRCW